MKKRIRIGTRESQLAVWQATLVQQLLHHYGYESELVYIKSEGDIDLTTPLYELGVQGIFTRSLDIALLNDRIDLAVHSMKDVPTQLPHGIVQSAVLKRASYKDLLVYKGDPSFLNDITSAGLIATSSIRRKAQWLHHYPNHAVENLRGNVNTRLRKVEESNWNGAIFAAAGLERINLRPEHSIELDWMLPAPAQGAIVTVCREKDILCLEAGDHLNDEHTALCTLHEKEFLRELMGGCSTPVSALAIIEGDQLTFKGNIFSVDGTQRADVCKMVPLTDAAGTGKQAALELLKNGGQAIADSIKKMNDHTITILTTRPLAHTAMLMAEEQGVKIDTVSFIETKSVVDAGISAKIRQYIPEDISVAFTSMNAAEAVLECLEWNEAVPDWTVYSLGGLTGTILTDFFEQGNVIAGAQNAKQLANDIIADGVKEIIFFCGNQRREELPQTLKDNNIDVTEIIVYETIETPVRIDNQYDGILFFSPSAAKSFFSVNKPDASAILFAIGATTAEALKKLSNNKVLVSSLPNKEHLAAQAIAYLNKTINRK